MKVCVLDMATLRFRWSKPHDAVSVLTTSHEPLATVAAKNLSPREAAGFGIEEAVDTGRVWRGGAPLPIALYNPYTAEIQFGLASAQTIYALQEPLAFDYAGIVAELDQAAGQLHFPGNIVAHAAKDMSLPAAALKLLAHRV